MFAAMLISFAVASPDRDISPQITAERVRRCGAGPTNLVFVPDFGPSIVISAQKSVSDKQLICMAKASPILGVQLPPAIQPRFDHLNGPRPFEWLAKHGFLKGLPPYDRSQSYWKFALAIEKLCHADGIFSRVYGPHSLSAEQLKRMSRALKDGTPFACIFQTANARHYAIDNIDNHLMGSTHQATDDSQISK